MLEKNLTRGVEPIVDACDLLDGLRKFLVSPRTVKQLGRRRAPGTPMVIRPKKFLSDFYSLVGSQSEASSLLTTQLH